MTKQTWRNIPTSIAAKGTNICTMSVMYVPTQESAGVPFSIVSMNGAALVTVTSLSNLHIVVSVLLHVCFVILVGALMNRWCL